MKAEECLYVGDHPENDVLGSEQVGILGVWKRDSFWGNFEHSRVVDDLLEVLSFLEIEKKQENSKRRLRFPDASSSFIIHIL